MPASALMAAVLQCSLLQCCLEQLKALKCYTWEALLQSQERGAHHSQDPSSSEHCHPLCCQWVSIRVSNQIAISKKVWEPENGRGIWAWADTLSAAFASRKWQRICKGCGCNHMIKSATSEGRTCPSKQGSDCCRGAEGKAARANLKIMMAIKKLKIHGNMVQYGAIHLQFWKTFFPSR